MVRQAFLQSRKDYNLISQFSNLKLDIIQKALETKDHGSNINTKIAGKFMQLVQTVTKALPHTDGAARKARGDIEAMCCHFGHPSYFLTVTFDEINGIEMQAYTGIDIDINCTTMINNLSKEELRKKAIWRKEISDKFPGYSAYYFSQLLDIVTEVIVGWDFKNNKPTEVGGLFGKPTAVSETIEEQSRTRLHVHILIWLKEMKKKIDELFNLYDESKRKNRNHSKKRKSIEIYVANEVDRISSTDIVTNICSQTNLVKKGRFVIMNVLVQISN